jgi:hypothetical protein
LVGAIHFYKIVWPWVWKAIKFVFGIASKFQDKEPTQSVQIVFPPGFGQQQPSQPDLQPYQGGPSGQPQGQGQAAGDGPPAVGAPQAIGHTTRQEFLDLRKSVDDLAKRLPDPGKVIVLREDLTRAIDEVVASVHIPTDLISRDEVGQMLRDFVRQNEFDSLEDRFSASEDRARAFRERVLQELAVILDRAKRRSGGSGGTTSGG